MMKGKHDKRVIGVVVLAAMVALGVSVGSEIWARKWEKRWTDFKAHWEGQGESFEFADYQPAAGEEALDFAMHPWLLAVEAGDPAVMEQLNKMDPDAIAGYADWRCGTDDADKLSPMPEELARRVLAHGALFAGDFNALAEAAARPQCRIVTKSYQGCELLEPPRWLTRLRKCPEAIAANAAAALAVGDEDTFANQMVLLLEIGRQLRTNHLMLSAVVGSGFEAQAYSMITDLAPQGLKQDANRAKLRAAIDHRTRPFGEEMAGMLRCERAMALHMMDQIEAGSVPSPVTYVRRPGFSAFRRVFFARNRLAICEDSQHYLLAPGGHPTACLNPDDLTRCDEAVRKRLAGASLFESFANLTHFAYRIPAGLLLEEENRQAARDALAGER